MSHTTLDLFETGQKGFVQIPRSLLQTPEKSHVHPFGHKSSTRAYIFLKKLSG